MGAAYDAHHQARLLGVVLERDHDASSLLQGLVLGLVDLQRVIMTGREVRTTSAGVHESSETVSQSCSFHFIMLLIRVDSRIITWTCCHCVHQRLNPGLKPEPEVCCSFSISASLNISQTLIG